MPTLLITEDGKAHSPRATVTEEVVSYQESFKQELIHFHDCVSLGRTPTTSARDALHDIALCEALVAVHRSGDRRQKPSEPAMAAASSEHA
jgi:predicted dehydrogenase